MIPLIPLLKDWNRNCCSYFSFVIEHRLSIGAVRSFIQLIEMSAEDLLDFNKPFDVMILDATVDTFLAPTPNQEEVKAKFF